MNVLKRDWKPDIGLRHVLVIVRCLLIEPFPGMVTCPNLLLPGTIKSFRLLGITQLELQRADGVALLHDRTLQATLSR